MKKTFILLVLTTLSITGRSSPADSTMYFYEDSLKILSKAILFSKEDFEKYNANKNFINILEEALDYDRKMEFPFDSLKNITHLVSPDKAFRILNWQLPRNDGTYEYFAFIQSLNPKTKKFEIHLLIDKSEEMTSAETMTLDENHWYGALYYKIIPVKKDDRKYYTLLGWDGNNSRSHKKIIEILYFRKDGQPVFGYPLFRNYGKNNKRILFEYSANSYMSLKYDNQYTIIPAQKKKSTPQKKEKVNLIVFDRIVPMDESLTGQYEFYIPETNVVDGFVFVDGRWVFVKDIDARNPKQENKVMPRDQRPPEFILYKPE